ncbi:MAG TPA: FAD-dependent oxidoreductase [Lentisphaeria bacterium]|nr:FAD-dependent oxidoreductase [Lentisphaeria bacterium]
MNIFHEPSRDIPCVEHVDVLVAGSGPAGIAAAMAAARLGASVRLIEQNGCLGGIWTSGLLCWILDIRNKQDGILREIVDALDRRGATWPVKVAACAFQPEAMKILLEDTCLAAGVRIRLHTRLCAAACDPGGRLATVITESTSGREAWGATCFVDATGNGDLAAMAGCSFDYGRPEDGKAQPMSLLALVSGPLASEIPEVMHDGSQPGRADKERLLALIRAGGFEPSSGMPMLIPLAPRLYALGNCNHIYGADALDSQALTDATIRARTETRNVVTALRSHGGPWSELQLVATAEHIGVREGRRIHGLHQVVVGEMEGGVRHPDPVCRATFGVDVHAITGGPGATCEPGIKRHVLPYDIPLRALIAADRDGLLLAGRCISGDFLSHSSYRQTGDAVPMGEAAGACAALAARTGRLPHQVAWSELAAALPQLGRLIEVQ